MVSDFPLSHEFSSTLHSKKKKRYEVLITNKECGRNNLCHLFDSSSYMHRCHSSVSLANDTLLRKQQHSTHLCCVPSSSKWKISNPCCSDAQSSMKWKKKKKGKLCRRVLNLNLPVNFINGIGQVKRLHCIKNHFTEWKVWICPFKSCFADIV